MNPVDIDRILPFVEKPSRYLGSEQNAVHKDLFAVSLRFALAFPDMYEIGMSHFGMQILYDILNREPEIAAERVFAPANDMAAELKARNLPLFTLESRMPVGFFDIVGFSLMYELNYTNVLMMLELAGIPLRAAERDGRRPLVIAGGPCTCNPEPVAAFFDAFLIGDGEAATLELARSWLAWKRDGAGDKEALLRRWSRIQGVYVPLFYEVGRNASAGPMVVPLRSDAPPVVRAVVADLDRVPFPEKPIVPFGKPVHDRLRLEISRGCSRGCRFCQAGMIYRPVRERSPESLLKMAEASLAATGYEDLSLLSLSSGDYGCMVPLLERLMDRHAADHVAVSLPSLRAGTLTPALMSLIKRVRKTGFTIAPEAGSQRLRDVINKNISRAEIIAAVENAFALGWRVIKLYFMIGLPTETDEDLQALVDLVKHLRRTKGGQGQINVSVATFIPKAHTPFQWAPQLGLEASRQRIGWLQDRLRLAGIQLKWQDPSVSLIEGVFARGDRSLSRLLEEAFALGCRFDGWSDQFDPGRWQQAFAAAGIDPDDYTTRARGLNESLPWDHLDMRVSKRFLQEEWRRAMSAETVADCRDGDCRQCGGCDFIEIAPRTHHRVDFNDDPKHSRSDVPAAGFRQLRVGYRKTGSAKYFGHLELQNMFLRAFRRAAIPLQFSQGFHPKPKVSFRDALPIGMESEAEEAVVSVPADIDPLTLADRLNPYLPGGVAVTDCSVFSRSAGPSSAETVSYRITLRQGQFDENALAAFLRQADPVIVRRRPNGGLKKLAIRDILVDVSLPDPQRLVVKLSAAPGKTLRPIELMQHIFPLSEKQLKEARIVKIRPDKGAAPKPNVL